MKVLDIRGDVQHGSASDPATAATPAMPNRGVLEELEATTQAVVAADEAHLEQALESVEWEQRGLFQTLRRRGPDRASRWRRRARLRTATANPQRIDTDLAGGSPRPETAA